jgi:hypothetical protein
MHAPAFRGIASRTSGPRPRASAASRRAATIVEVRGRAGASGAEASYLFSVREGGDAQGAAVYAVRGRQGVEAARAQAFRWCREHGYEVVGYIEVPPRR